MSPLDPEFRSPKPPHDSGPALRKLLLFAVVVSGALLLWFWPHGGAI